MFNNIQVRLNQLMSMPVMPWLMGIAIGISKQVQRNSPTITQYLLIFLDNFIYFLNENNCILFDICRCLYNLFLINKLLLYQLLISDLRLLLMLILFQIVFFAALLPL